MKRRRVSQAGFTLVELMLAMTVFSFMLIIIVSGFINIVHIRNQAVASNTVQDSARTAMDELVRAVRNSSEVVPSAPDTLCLSLSNGQDQVYYLSAGVLTRAYANANTACVNRILGTEQSITATSVQVAALTVTKQTTVAKPEYQITVTVASNNGTTIGSGAATACNNTNADRNFCSVVTLTSGAIAR